MNSTMTMTSRPVRKELSTTIKSVNPSKREIEFVASQRVIDGEGEVIEPSVVDLSRYRKTPIFTLATCAHRPVGRTVSLMLQSVDGIPSLLRHAALPEVGHGGDLARHHIPKVLIGNGRG